jgi:hypothetical protein
MFLSRLIAGSLFVLLMVNAAYAAGSIYSVGLIYDSGSLSLVEMHLTEGFPDAGSDGNPFECRLVSAEGIVISSLKFGIPLRVCYDEIDSKTGKLSGGCVMRNKAEFRLFIPYDPGAKKMDFYDENNVLLLSLDLSKYSETAQVIASKAGVQGSGSDKGIEDASVQKENIILEDTHQNADVNYIYLALFLFAVALVGFFAYMRLKR